MTCVEHATPIPLTPSMLIMTRHDFVGLYNRHASRTHPTFNTWRGRAQPISKAPSNVYVVTADDIIQSGAVDVPSALRRVPGIEIIQMTGGQYDIRVRGNNQEWETGSSRLLILIDGRSIYDDTSGQGGINWKALPITLPEIKQIEVLKGPASSVYGYNAFDGVIDIITKSPEEMEGSTLQLARGEFGTVTSSAVHAGHVGNLGYRISAGHDQNSQWDEPDALGFRANKFNVHTKYDLPDSGILTAEGGMTDTNRYDGPVQEAIHASATRTDTYARLGYAKKEFYIRGFWRRTDATSDNGIHPSLTSALTGKPFVQILGSDRAETLSIPTNTFDLETQNAFTLPTFGHFTYGANYRHITVGGNLLDEEHNKEHRFGVYLENEW